MSKEQETIVIPADGAGFDRQDPQAFMIALFAIASVVALILVMLAVQIFYQHGREQQIYEKVLLPVSQDLLDLRAREDSNLHSYGYINKEKTQIRVPIERAMDLIVKEYADGKLRYSMKPTPVKPLVPAAAPAPGTSGAPVQSTPNVVGKTK